MIEVTNMNKQHYKNHYNTYSLLYRSVNNTNMSSNTIQISSRSLSCFGWPRTLNGAMLVVFPCGLNFGSNKLEAFSTMVNHCQPLTEECQEWHVQSMYSKNSILWQSYKYITNDLTIMTVKTYQITAQLTQFINMNIY